MDAKWKTVVFHRLCFQLALCFSSWFNLFCFFCFCITPNMYNGAILLCLLSRQSKHFLMWIVCAPISVVMRCIWSTTPKLELYNYCFIGKFSRLFSRFFFYFIWNDFWFSLFRVCVMKKQPLFVSSHCIGCEYFLELFFFSLLLLRLNEILSRQNWVNFLAQLVLNSIDCVGRMTMRIWDGV